MFHSSVGARTWRSSGGVYAPEDPKVLAPTEASVNTEVTGCETRVSTARFRRVETVVSPPALYQMFHSSVGARTWRSSGGVYAPEDPKVLAPTEARVNTEVTGCETRVSTTRFRRVETVVSPPALYQKLPYDRQTIKTRTCTRNVFGRI
jgi:hypothetical protein